MNKNYLACILFIDLNTGRSVCLKNIIVPTNIYYTWDIINLTIRKLKKRYPFLHTESIGKSVMGNDIFEITLGCGEKKVLLNGAHHANEWITSVLLMKFVENYCRAYEEGACLCGENIRKLWSKKRLCIVPMVNPDGVNLVNGAIAKETPYYKNAVKISSEFPDIPFPSGWKANIEGTDLNLNYPAGWNNAKNIKYALGFNKPSPKNYVGDAPLSCPESRAMYNYSVFNSFCMTLSYHTQGKVIYWKYLDYLPENSEKIALELCKASGYTMDITPIESGFAGYKDWFISHYNMPGYTIEAGEGKNPLDIRQFDEIYNDNEGLLITAAKLA